jgi:hypothetical protein
MPRFFRECLSLHHFEELGRTQDWNALKPFQFEEMVVARDHIINLGCESMSKATSGPGDRR